MPNYYHPTKKMTRALFTELGFTEPDPTAADRIGGHVFTRHHTDGRHQVLYVFHWSNFRIAEAEGILPCRLSIRVRLDGPADDETAIATAPHGEHTFISYGGSSDWDAVRGVVTNTYMPILDAPPSDGDEALRILLALDGELSV
ncbi:hypothetical protein ACWGJ9_10860 [Curtobacterium citreum]